MVWVRRMEVDFLRPAVGDQEITITSFVREFLGPDAYIECSMVDEAGKNGFALPHDRRLRRQEHKSGDGLAGRYDGAVLRKRNTLSRVDRFGVRRISPPGLPGGGYDGGLLRFHSFHIDINNRGDFFPRSLLSQPAFQIQLQETGFWSKDEGMLVIVSQDDTLLEHIEFFKTVNYLNEFELSYQVYAPEQQRQGRGY